MTPMLQGAAVIVTGASGGIGSAIVDRSIDHGARVVAHRRRPPAESDRDDVVWVSVDLTAPDAPDRLVDAAVESFGRLDGLVNNAAVQDVVAFDDLTDEEWRHTLEVNLTAPHRLTRAAAEAMRYQDDGGSVVHIASIEARQAAAGHAHYNVSKAGLLMHARAAAMELGPNGVRVNSVLPGLIDRPGLAVDWPEGVERWESSAPLGRLGTANEVADAVVFLLSPMAGFITGAELTVDGGVSTRPTW